MDVQMSEEDEQIIRHYGRIALEYCIGAFLQHPNIITSYDLVKEGSHWYEVME